MKTRNLLKGYVGTKGVKYMMRHPVKGTRNMLALRGAKSLAASRGAAVTAAVATAAMIVPLALRAMKSSEG